MFTRTPATRSHARTYAGKAQSPYHPALFTCKPSPTRTSVSKNFYTTDICPFVRQKRPIRVYSPLTASSESWYQSTEHVYSSHGGKLVMLTGVLINCRDRKNSRPETGQNVTVYFRLPESGHHTRKILSLVCWISQCSGCCVLHYVALRMPRSS